MPASQVRASQIKRLTGQLSKKQIAWRRHLHMYPEPSTAEHKTTAYLKKEVKKLVRPEVVEAV